MEAERQVEYGIAKDFAEQNNMKYYEASAKTNDDINTVFSELASEIMNKLNGHADPCIIEK